MVLSVTVTGPNALHLLSGFSEHNPSRSQTITSFLEWKRVFLPLSDWMLGGSLLCINCNHLSSSDLGSDPAVHSLTVVIRDHTTSLKQRIICLEQTHLKRKHIQFFPKSYHSLDLVAPIFSDSITEFPWTTPCLSVSLESSWQMIFRSSFDL